MVFQQQARLTSGLGGQGGCPLAGQFSRGLAGFRCGGYARAPARAATLLLLVLALPAVGAHTITWPQGLYNPRPLADDLILPLPCGGALALRAVPTPPRERGYAVTGAFEQADGIPLLLLGKYEVTLLQAQTIQAEAAGTPCPMADATATLPFTGGWWEAVELADRYSRWLAAHADEIPACGAGVAPCLPRVDGVPAYVRLPTAAEWEYAARGGLSVTAEQFAAPRYPMRGGLAAHAWYRANAHGRLQPIGGLAANPLALHDLYGNAAEWVLDALAQGSERPDTQSAAIALGGDAGSGDRDLAATRGRTHPPYAATVLSTGLRLAAGVPIFTSLEKVREAERRRLTQPNKLDEPFSEAPGPAPKPMMFVGGLRVAVNVPAEVRLDGKPVGTAFLGRPLELESVEVGERHLEVSASGYSTVTSVLRIRTGRREERRVELERLAGQLCVSVNVPAEILLDGAIVGKATPERPLECTAVVIGEHLLEVNAPGRLTATQTRRIEANERAQVHVELATKAPKAPAGAIPGQAAAPGEPALGVDELGKLPTEVLLQMSAYWMAVRTGTSGDQLSRERRSVRQVANAYGLDSRRVEILLPMALEIWDDSVKKAQLLLGAARVEPDMIEVPGGEFWMGSPATERDGNASERPRRKVHVEPFAIGRTEVTFAQYDEFIEARGKANGRSNPDDNGWGRAKQPVINVSWEDAAAYAAWLSEETGEQYRLPSEAEWEYAARAGTSAPFWTGRCIDTTQANYDGKRGYAGCGGTSGVSRKQTLPVASFKPNPFGLHDTAGNVWEWVQDPWHASYVGAPAGGSPWEDGGRPFRIIRGGSFAEKAGILRSAVRDAVGPKVRGTSLGFRLARTSHATPPGTAGLAEAGAGSAASSKVEGPQSNREAVPASAQQHAPMRLASELPFVLEMIVLPGGVFSMGSLRDEPERHASERPRHEVLIAPFALGKTEVTFAQYDAFVEATAQRKPSDSGWGRGDRPVINVSWNDALAYTAWLSKETGETYRLPSEAEWEYAARAGMQTQFWTGRCIHTDQANYDGRYDYGDCGAKTGVYRRQTVPVGSFRANPWGIHDIAGNVWEWVQDRYHVGYLGAPADSSAWESGKNPERVLRGGSWFDVPRVLRSANRSSGRPENWSYMVGFRVAKSLLAGPGSQAPGRAVPASDAALPAPALIQPAKPAAQP